MPYRSELDKNISPFRKRFQQLVKRISKNSVVGLHPSVYSSTDKKALQVEKNLLSSISELPITKSRFHFLKCLLPEDYHRLIDAGITDDYTMGYGTINGFRASTSRSFLWYDLSSETTTTLRVHPFCWMDANSYYEQKISAEEAYAELLSYMVGIKKVNGTMMTVVHNHLLGTDPICKGWGEVYGRFIGEVVANK